MSDKNPLNIVVGRFSSLFSQGHWLICDLYCCFHVVMTFHDSIFLPLTFDIAVIELPCVMKTYLVDT